MMTTNSSNTSIFSSNIHLLRYISVISFLATKYEDGYIFETTGYRKNYFLIGLVYQIASSIGQSCFYQPATVRKPRKNGVDEQISSGDGILRKDASVAEQRREQKSAIF